MPKPRLAILLGHSHTGSLVSAATASKPSASPDHDQLHLLMYEAFKFNGQPPYLSADTKGTERFNPAVLDAAAPYVAGLGPPAYITSFGGNDWAVLALMQHSRPFDFILPEEPDLPVHAGAELLPFSYVRSLLNPLNDRYNYLLFLLRQATADPIYAVLPPPPIGDDAVIEERMDDFFRGKTDFTHKVSTRFLRKKMWLLQRQIQAKVCRENDITLLDVPASARTDDGFLNPACYGRDATHANPTYGKMVLGQIEERLNAKFFTYHWFS